VRWGLWGCLLVAAAIGTSCAGGPSALVQDLPDGSLDDRLALGEPVELGQGSVRVPLRWSAVKGHKLRWQEPGVAAGGASMAVTIAEGKPEGTSYKAFWAKTSAERSRGAVVEEEGEVGLGSLPAWAMTVRQVTDGQERGVRVYLVVGVRETWVLTYEAPWSRWADYAGLFQRSAESITLMAHEPTARRQVRVADATLVLPEGWTAVPGEDGTWSAEGGELLLDVAMDAPKPADQDAEAFWRIFSARYLARSMAGAVVQDELALEIGRQPAWALQLRRTSEQEDVGVTVVVVAEPAHVIVMRFEAPWARYEAMHPTFMQCAASLSPTSP